MIPSPGPQDWEMGRVAAGRASGVKPQPNHRMHHQFTIRCADSDRNLSKRANNHTPYIKIVNGDRWEMLEIDEQRGHLHRK